MAWIALPVWHGTTAEATALTIAIVHNCVCVEVKARCGAHQAMLEQRWLDGVLWGRHMRAQLLKEEGVLCLDTSP